MAMSAAGQGGRQAGRPVSRWGWPGREFHCLRQGRAGRQASRECLLIMALNVAGRSNGRVTMQGGCAGRWHCAASSLLSNRSQRACRRTQTLAAAVRATAAAAAGAAGVKLTVLVVVVVVHELEEAVDEALRGGGLGAGDAAARGQLGAEGAQHGLQVLEVGPHRIVGVEPACAWVGVGMAWCGEEVWQSRRQIGLEGAASAGAVERRRSGLQLRTTSSMRRAYRPSPWGTSTWRSSRGG